MTQRLAPRRLLAGTAGAALCAGAAMADPFPEPFALIPSNAPGLSTGFLQPEATNIARIGTRQPNGSTNGTGTQVYDGGLSFRGYWPFQLGFSASAFDDPPNQPIEGSLANITTLSFGIDAKFNLIETPRYALSLEANATYLSYGVTGGAEDEQFTGASVSLPATYRLTDEIFAGGALGYATLPDEMAGVTGFGDRGFVSAHLGWQPTNRILLYGSATSLLGRDDTGPEGDESALYTVGARYSLTPQLAANAYVTTGYANTPLLNSLAFFPARGEPVFGAELVYAPSGKRFDIPRYGTPIAAVDKTLTFGDGVTLMGPETIGTDELRLEASLGSTGNARLAAYVSPDPDAQLEVVLEDYALEETTGFRTEAAEDTRYSFGARYQALSQAEGDPVTAGARVMFGRDIDEPTVGVLFAEAAVSYEFASGLDLNFNPKFAAFGSDGRLYGAGLGMAYDLTERTQLLGEVTLRDDGADPVYGFGVRHVFTERMTAMDIYVTNAAGRTGIGSMLAGDTQIGASFTYQTPFRSF